MSACRAWNDRLLEYALGTLRASAVKELEKHLSACAACSAALDHWRAQREQMDAALRQLVRRAEPSLAFRARVLAATEASAVAGAARPAWVGALAAVTVVLLGGMVLGSIAGRWAGVNPPAAVPLSEWRSPTEGLLRSPTGEWLQAAPRLGEFYFPLQSAALGGDEKNEGDNES